MVWYHSSSVEWMDIEASSFLSLPLINEDIRFSRYVDDPKVLDPTVDHDPIPGPGVSLLIPLLPYSNRSIAPFNNPTATSTG